MRSFAIEEPGSPVPALYATLPQRIHTSSSTRTKKAIMIMMTVVVVIVGDYDGGGDGV